MSSSARDLLRTLGRWIRSAGMAASLFAIAFWVWRAVYEVEASQMEPLTFLYNRSWLYLLFALPAILSVTALARRQLRAIRIIAAVCNVLVGTWWIAYPFSGSGPLPLSVYLLLAFSLGCAHMLGFLALVSD